MTTTIHIHPHGAVDITVEEQDFSTGKGESEGPYDEGPYDPNLKTDEARADDGSNRAIWLWRKARNHPDIQWRIRNGLLEVSPAGEPPPTQDDDFKPSAEEMEDARQIGVGIDCDRMNAQAEAGGLAEASHFMYLAGQTLTPGFWDLSVPKIKAIVTWAKRVVMGEAVPYPEALDPSGVVRKAHAALADMPIGASPLSTWLCRLGFEARDAPHGVADHDVFMLVHDAGIAHLEVKRLNDVVHERGLHNEGTDVRAELRADGMAMLYLTTGDLTELWKEPGDDTKYHRDNLMEALKVPDGVKGMTDLTEGSAAGIAEVKSKVMAALDEAVPMDCEDGTLVRIRVANADHEETYDIPYGYSGGEAARAAELFAGEHPECKVGNVIVGLNITMLGQVKAEKS